MSRAVMATNEIAAGEAAPAPADAVAALIAETLATLPHP